MSADRINQFISFGSLFIAFLALGVAYLSWRASVQGIKATVYQHRYEIYVDAERYLSAWLRDGRPDLSLLGTLVGAWSRSQFLCRDEVTKYLRKVWTDSLEVDYQHKIVSGDLPGDYDKAVELVHRVFREHADFDKLRAVFMSDLKVKS